MCIKEGFIGLHCLMKMEWQKYKDVERSVCIMTEITIQMLSLQGHMSLVVRKPVFGVSDQVRHKPGCTTTEDGQRLEILDLGSRGIVLSV